jgi:hypothetical protein
MPFDRFTSTQRRMVRRMYLLGVALLVAAPVGWFCIIQLTGALYFGNAPMVIAAVVTPLVIGSGIYTLLRARSLRRHVAIKLGNRVGA